MLANATIAKKAGEATNERAQDSAEQPKIDETAGPIYVSYREVKGAPVHTTKHSKKAAYIKHFYLIDVHGNETLAACGEDQGEFVSLTSSLRYSRYSTFFHTFNLINYVQP